MPITLTDAWVNTLQGVSLTLDDGALVAFTGVSGSGKSSLAVDVIFAEAQREYLEGLNSFVGRFFQSTRRPRVGTITGLSPTLLLNQRPLGRQPRSTVGTALDLYASLRLLFSRAGTPGLSASAFSFNRPEGQCPVCRGLGVDLAINPRTLLALPLSLREGALRHPLYKVGGKAWSVLAATGWFPLDTPLAEFTPEQRDLLLNAPPQAVTRGHVDTDTFRGVALTLLRRQQDGRGLKARETDAPYLIERPCPACAGTRLNEAARAVRWRGLGIGDFTTCALRDLPPLLDRAETPIETLVVEPIRRAVLRMLDLGLGYLSLNRSSTSLSGGEAQRIKIARQLGGSLCDLIYVLDEPLASLHPDDCPPVIEAINALRDKGNTVLVVEHNRLLLQRVDRIVVLGPGGGRAGGRIVGDGSPTEIAAGSDSLARYLRDGPQAPPRPVRPPPPAWLTLPDLRLNNLDGITLRLPEERLTGLTGVSGAGKSSLLQAIQESFPDAVFVDQAPPGRSSRSAVATYCGAMEGVRAVFAEVSGQGGSLFSFNGAGACPECHGLGLELSDDAFLDDGHQVCPACEGQRFRAEVLEHRLEGRSIADVLALTVGEALAFPALARAHRALAPLAALGLAYLSLGQPLTTLSGGEIQRLKLAEALGQQGRLYLLDEPARGLGPDDVLPLIATLHRLIDAGNTVVVAEHAPAVLAACDWLIDIGPGAGDRGGRLIDEGPPEAILERKRGAGARLLATLPPFPDQPKEHAMGSLSP